MLPALDVDATRCTMNAMLRRVSVAPTSRRSLAIARALPQHDRTSVLGRPSLLPASVGGVWLPGLAQPPAHHRGLPTTDASPAGAHDELMHSQTRMRPSMSKSSSCVPLLVDQREGGALVCMDEQALLYENEDAVRTLSRLSLEPHALPVRASRSSAAALLADGQPKGGACAAAQEVLDGALLASVLEWLPTPTLRTVATLVNKTWSTSAATAASWRVASGVMSARLELRPVATAPPKGGRARSGKGGEARGATREVLVLGDGIVVHQPWHNMFRVFPWGRFLSSGAYKKVHQVWNAAARRAEALSVMDVRALAGTGNLPVIQSEIAVGWLLSECVRSRVCPHYVRCYEVALVGWSPEHDFPTMWGSETEPIPQGRTFVPGPSHPAYAHGVCVPPAPRAREEGRGPYQYIRMELCDGGDLETFLRRLEPLLPDASGRTPSTSMLAPSDAQYSATVQAWAFQMCFSLFVARERLALRHYDVKCLNFFLQSAESNANTAPGSSGLNGGLEYVIGSRRFQLPWSAAAAGAGGAAWLVKLADYGTCDMQPSTLGGPFKSYHFTTIDNAPPEFFIMGNQVVQAYATDTWALGLTLLHCLTGDCPYEEILASVKCPPRLHAVWRQLWSAHPQFSALGAVLDESNEASAPGGCDFANTLYRILVLTAPVAITRSTISLVSTWLTTIGLVIASGRSLARSGPGSLFVSYLVMGAV
ncbi:MAG: hypothetical protein EOO65_01120 [Methanosarcinales archaeon]|nr:MAG: hypothetical protein EOO65_01120 [Methanosarcinales archaeon]